MIAPGALRPSHPVPNVRDDRDTPLLWDGITDSIMLILANREAEYFFPDDWTGFCAARPSGKSLRAKACTGDGPERDRAGSVNA
jgi:hypothetical protein